MINLVCLCSTGSASSTHVCPPLFSQIMGINLPTGIPFYYELDEDLKPVKSMEFLGDEETVRKAIESVAAQGKVKK